MKKSDFKYFKNLKKYWVGIILISITSGCMSDSEYQKIKKRELASGKIYNDLFLDLKFGMSPKEFFSTCWEHNKNGILTNGAHHLQVQYQPELASQKTVNMFFYPEFEEGKLFFMPIEFYYTDWFPNREGFSNEELMEDVITLFKTWYGDGFFEVSNKEKKISAMVKIDGNRLIRVYKKDINTVRAEILDLRVKEIDELNQKNEAS